ncbi:hypothetical protein FIBSPDRAFT_1037670 [Athelia psychrophila]|uniref:NUDE domain-containing protein n=1 Tax=Athelia psychrophila TaxID=1759441 RepID=A0A166U1C6_9AGAM|nr:hypothetical protein FIBSPDRAFT_1037670 [Fibularhizoctonia sp. CBS 109695]
MTAVMQAVDALYRDKTMASDDSQINYSNGHGDWRNKYNEVADMLAETRGELDEFHASSKELEDELIKEIDRTEKAQQDLKVKVARTEMEREDWKSKFVSLQTTHNTTTTSLQRELDKLRQEYQKIKVQLRELEMGNDDLERNERAVSSSLADIEAKYSRALEEKILLEHELLDKANLEEDTQRLRDELRDANVEISILKDQIVSSKHSSRAESIISEPESASAGSVSLFTTPISQPITPSFDNLLKTPPPDMHLSELFPAIDESPEDATPTRRLAISTRGHSAALKRPNFLPPMSAGSGSSSSPAGIVRSSTLPQLSPSRIPPRSPVPRPTIITRNISSSSAMSSSTTSATASKSKGVQMVTEMRARVRILEQKIHTRVPRIRMGSMSTKSNANTVAAQTLSAHPAGPSYSPTASTAINMMRSTSLRNRGAVDDRTIKPPPLPGRRSVELDTKAKRTPVADTSGWVLIMEDSPSPIKHVEKERRRTSSPPAPTSFRLGASTAVPSPQIQPDKGGSLYKSTMNTGIRRPQSRLSAASASTTATTSSIPTPSSRPSTPTFLPVPSAGLYAHSSTAGITGLKRSTGPNSGAYMQPKRASLGTPSSPSDDESHMGERPITYSYRSDAFKGLPQLPSLQSNITLRAPSKFPASSSLSKSRIGRPGGNARRGSGPASPLPDMDFSELSTASSDGSGRQRAASAYDRHGY